MLTIENSNFDDDNSYNITGKRIFIRSEGFD
jgi:hypothetical protein